MRWFKRQWLPGLDSRSGAQSAARCEIYDDDLFLVSYPKSGNTWMRFLLSNLLRETDGGRGRSPVDFHTAVEYVPEYELHTDVVRSVPRPRILKSHSVYDPAFPRVVYLVRDPRDVYVSYFHYMQKRLDAGMDLSAFLRMRDIHPCHWHEHVSGWVDRPNVLLIRYEDLLADTLAQLRRCIDFWGRRAFSDDTIDRAVRASSFENMKRLERKHGRPFRSEDHRRRSTVFMRKGERGDWVNHLAPADLAYLYKGCGDLMRRLGYEEYEAPVKRAG